MHRIELSPQQRAVWTVVAVALLLWGAGGGHARFFAALAGFYLILYAAGGGRVPWEISARDYFLYVAISVAIVAAILVYAFVQVHGRR